MASRYLSTTYLWDAIRVQGGAYGAGATFDLTSGIWMYCSWRDPNLLATVQAFDSKTEMPAWVVLSANRLRGRGGWWQGGERSPCVLLPPAPATCCFAPGSS